MMLYTAPVGKDTVCQLFSPTVDPIPGTSAVPDTPSSLEAAVQGVLLAGESLIINFIYSSLFLPRLKVDYGMSLSPC